MSTNTASLDLETFAQDLPDFIPGMIALYNINSGKYVYVNPAIKKILGYSPDDFMKKGMEFVASLVHPDDFPMIIEKNQAALEQANSSRAKNNDTDPIVNFEYRMKHKEGHWIWLHTDGIVYDRTPDGKVNHVINISLDITRRRSSEDYLKHMAEELKVLNKTKDEFITVASHQLRTPATAIKQYLGLLLGGYSDPLTDDQQNFLEKAYESNQRQLSIVEDILRTAQLDADKLRLHFVKCDINSIVDEAVKCIALPFQKKEQKLVWERPKKPIKVKVDRGQILMVLENLLENASLYSENAKTIKISVETTPKKVEIIVGDEGVGIKQTDIQKLFQKFSRITNRLSIEAGGSGLGLYWAQKIVKMHDGKIEARSKLHKGTEFIVSLPIASS